MTLRRRFVSLLLATAVSGAAWAQQVQPDQLQTAVGESLNLRFANGIVAVAEEKIITVADVMREVAPLLPGIQREARSEKEYNDRVEQLYDDAIQELIDRVLIIKEFRKDEKRHIPISYVDNAMADELAGRFEGDRSKFLAYLRSQGKTIRDYRRDKEEEIIYHYMQGQQRRSQSLVSPVRIETFYNENKDRFYQEDRVHLRLIQLSKTEGDSDEMLVAQANRVLDRLRSGEKFEELAREYSRDARRSRGGDWGWLQRSDFRQEFSEVAFKLEKGQASEPLVLPEGVFILYAEDRKYAGIQPIDEVRDSIERILLQQMARSNHERWLERLRRNGYVKYY
ncbi:MAG: peptidylprolyl isomerase [Opitutus sp.]